MKISIILKNTNKKSKNYKKVKEIYYEAFPKHEQIPLFLLNYKIKTKKSSFMEIYDENKIIGMAYIATYKNIAYIFFLAIDKNARGSGYGGKVLEAIKEKYKGYNILLNIENIDKNAENYEQRIKRKKFYIKNGFKDLDYTLTKLEYIYEVLGYGENIKKQDYNEIMEYFFGKVIYKIISNKK